MHYHNNSVAVNMQEIKNCLSKYKEITLKLIKQLEIEDYDSLEGLLDSRQGFIDEISKMSYSKEDMNKIYEELQIQQLQDQLHFVMNEKKQEVKDNIDSLSINKVAKDKYTNGFKADYYFLNKKI